MPALPWLGGGMAAGGDGLAGYRLGYCALVVVATLLQFIFFHDPDNAWCVGIAAASSLVGLLYSLEVVRFRQHPISCLMLMFYTTTSTSGALLVKTLEWTALVERLSVPRTTFMVLAATQVVLILSHMVYSRVPSVQAFRSHVSRWLYNPAGLFMWPTDVEFWLLGLIGCVSLVLTGTDYESGASFGAGSAGIKMLRAFQFLKFAPFLIPFRNGLSGFRAPNPSSYAGLMAYFLLLVLLSFATNSRSTFADSVPTVGICVLMAMAYNAFSLKSIPTWKIVAVILGAFIASSLLSRVALAMVVVRDFRSTVDVMGLVGMTLEALTNSEWLEIARTKMDAAVTIGNYSEEYVNSRFLARFLLTKYHDNILYYFSFFGPDHFASYADFIKDRMWATLPDPILQKLGVNINKEDLVISNGDYIVYMIDGWGLGGFKTGSMIAEVYSVFGVLFPAVMFVGSMLLYVFYDALVADAPSGRKVVSPLIILLIWNLCGTTAAFGLGAETVVQIPAGIVRGLTQNIMFYFIAVYSVRKLARLF
jgi:hypothetical protein